MRTIGSRELKAHLGEVLRRVREHHEEYAVTYRGRPIARLIPDAMAEVGGSTDLETLWAEMDRVADEVGREWPQGVSAAEAVGEDRREL